MTRSRFVMACGAAGVAALVLAGCSNGGDGGAEEGGPVTLTMSGWSLDTTPEFQLLADDFMALNPDVTVEVQEYDAAEYNTLVTADLAAGSGPDIITQKEVKFVTTFQEGGQLLDVSDVPIPDDIGGASSYEIDGARYAVPYRQDSWVLFYNKGMFATAGVAEPDGSWTWDDYADAAAAITTANAAAGSQAKGAYLHRWQSTVQGFANAQADGDILGGDYAYMEPFYETVIEMQDAGSQVSYNASQANQLTYQGEFGGQNAAMMPMGTWYVATLISQQAAGEADDFEWGMAPVPQADASSTGLDSTPVTFGDPAGFSVNANISEAEQAAAKEFLEFAASADAAQALAEIGITPALLTDEVVEAYFAVEGVPQDELSRFAFTEHDTYPENPTASTAAAVQNILLDLHTSVMSGSTPIADAVTEADDRVASEVGSL